MSTTTYGWLVLAFPLAGMLVTALGFRAWRGHAAGWIATGAIFLAFLAALGALISLQGHSPQHRELVSSLWNYAVTVGATGSGGAGPVAPLDAKMSILVDPLSVYMILVV